MIQIKNLSKKYGDFYALKDINLTLPSKGLIGISGESGSGKTTLLNALALMDKEYKGKILINNKNILRFNEDKVNKYHLNIGYIFQAPYLFNFCSVKENVEYMSLLKGKKDKVDEVLKRVGLEKYKDKKVNALSGGQRQRVSIAASLISNPKILLCDEPTGALDSDNSVKVMGILKEVSKDILVIIVSHDFKLLKEYADDIIFLEDGKQVNKLDNSIDDKKIIYNKPNILNKFLFIFKIALKNILNHRKRTLITSFMVSFGLIGVIISIVLKDGFSNFFKETLGSYSTNKYLYCYKISDNNDIEIIIDTFYEDFKGYEKGYFYKYEFKEESETINNKITYLDNDMYLNFNNLAYLKKGDKFIKSNEIALEVSKEYLNYLYYLFKVDTLDDLNRYLRMNNTNLNFEYLDNKMNLDFELKLAYVKESNSDYTYFVHATPGILKDYFKDYLSLKFEDNQKIVMLPYLKNIEDKKSDLLLSENKKKYDYVFNNKIYDEDYTFVVKSNYYRIDINEALEMSKLINSPFYFSMLKGIDTLGKFPSSFTFGSNVVEINGNDISFTPLECNLSNYEVIVSSKLYELVKSNKLGVKKGDKYYELEIKDVVEDDELIIYHNSYWSYAFFKDVFDYKDYECIGNTIAFLDSSDENLNILSEAYSNLDFVCPLKEVNKEIEKMVDKVQLILLVLSSFCIVISILLMAVIIFINTIEQEKLVGVLRINGIDKTGVILIFLSEGLILGIMSFVISLWFSIVFTIELNMVFNMLLSNEIQDIIEIKKDTLISVFKWVVIMSIVSSFIPSYIASNKKVLKILKG